MSEHEEREQIDPDELDQHDPDQSQPDADLEQDPAYNPPEGPLKDMKGG